MAAHTPETRERALEMIRAGRSYRDVHDATGVALGTLSKWAGEAGIEPAGAEQTAAAAEKTRLAWAQRRQSLVDELGEVAAELLKKARDAEGREAQAYMTAVAIGVDKAQLLSGGVTSRHEQLDAQRRRERVAELQDDLAARRAAKDAATGG